MIRRLGSACVVMLVSWAAVPRYTLGQNDWQFPDPRFGILQSGRFPTPADEQRYRTEIAGATRPTRPPEPRRKRGRLRNQPGVPAVRSR